MTASEFRYLQAIEMLKQQNGKVIMTDIAAKLAFARASVYKKLLSLEQQGYVVKQEDKSITVTQKGIKEYESIKEMSSICADILEEHCKLERRLVMHDAVNMACVLSQRCKSAISSNK